MALARGYAMVRNRLARVIIIIIIIIIKSIELYYNEVSRIRIT